MGNDKFDRKDFEPNTRNDNITAGILIDNFFTNSTDVTQQHN